MAFRPLHQLDTDGRLAQDQGLPGSAFGQHNEHVPRMLLRALAAVVLTLLAAVAVPATLACACSCAAQDTDHAMAGASTVFDGTVVAARQPPGGDSSAQVEYTIDVARVYQGSVPARVIVRSAVSGASCGAELSGKVTVFAQGTVESLSTTSCSAPVRLDRSRLGAGYPPSAPLEAPATVTGLDTEPLFWGVLAGVVVLVAAAILVARRRR